MINVILAIWTICLCIVTVYYVFFAIMHSRIKNPVRIQTDWPMVSIIIAVKNDATKLAKGWNAISSQQYPHYEIMVVDDQSAPEQTEILQQLTGSTQRAKLLRTTGVSGKKNAITTGVHQANGEYILVTDADCRPLSDGWIRMMMQAAMTSDAVLGYSPYRMSQGWLNRLVRFETVMTAVQYFSWAISGRPYMAVGRNMMYRKEVFEKIKPYRPDDIPYGDDDLLVQKMAGGHTVGISIDENSFVETLAPSNLSEWWRQKHRHMSAAAHYTFAQWWQPGAAGIAMIGMWTLWIPLAVHMPFTILLLFGQVMIFRWVVFDIWAKQLNERKLTIWYPVLEIMYVLYLSGMGVYTIFKKKKAWN